MADLPADPGGETSSALPIDPWRSSTPCSLFCREKELTGDGELIVWPSNEQLMARANGMPATTLRRHLAVLVDCGLIIRRDSPNGKRFARKGRGGR